MASLVEREDVTSLKDALGDAILFVKENRGDLYVGIEPGRLVETATHLRDIAAYDYFVECLGLFRLRAM